MRANREWVDPFSHDIYFNKKLLQFIETLDGKLMNSNTLLKSKFKLLIQDCNTVMDKYIQIVKDNFLNLVLFSKANKYNETDFLSAASLKSRQFMSEFVKPRDQRRSRDSKLKRRMINKEPEDVTPFQCATPQKPSNPPMRKHEVFRRMTKKRRTDYYDNWRSPPGSEESRVLYYFFLSLSYLIDKIRGKELTKNAEGIFDPPQTNLRVFVKGVNALYLLLAILLVVFTIYYVVF